MSKIIKDELKFYKYLESIGFKCENGVTYVKNDFTIIFDVYPYYFMYKNDAIFFSTHRGFLKFYNKHKDE